VRQNLNEDALSAWKEISTEHHVTMDSSIRDVEMNLEKVIIEIDLSSQHNVGFMKTGNYFRNRCYFRETKNSNTKGVF